MSSIISVFWSSLSLVSVSLCTCEKRVCCLVFCKGTASRIRGAVSRLCSKQPQFFRHDLNNEVFSLFSADGPPVVGHYDISDTDSNQESMSVETVRATVIKHELKTHRGQDMAAHSGCIRALSSLAGQLQTRYIFNWQFLLLSVKTRHVEAWVSSICNVLWGNGILKSQQDTFDVLLSASHTPLACVQCYIKSCCIASSHKRPFMTD